MKIIPVTTARIRDTSLASPPSSLSSRIRWRWEGAGRPGGLILIQLQEGIIVLSRRRHHRKHVNIWSIQGAGGQADREEDLLMFRILATGSHDFSYNSCCRTKQFSLLSSTYRSWTCLLQKFIWDFVKGIFDSHCNTRAAPQPDWFFSQHLNSGDGHHQ